MADVIEPEVAAEEVTAPAEEPVVETSGDQEEDASVREFEARLEAALQLLTENAQKLEDETRARAAAEAKAQEQERIYKGYQASTTPKLQRLAEIERRQQADQAVLSRLDNLETLLTSQAMAGMMPEEKERYELQLERQKLERDKAALQQARQQPTDRQPTVDVETRKRELFNQYFPNSSVDVGNPRIDWAMDEPNWDSWEARFRASVQAIELENRSQSFETEREAILQAAEERVRQERERANQIAQDARESAARAATEARERARLDKEERLRRLGVDVIEPVIPEAALGPRSLDEQYPVDPSWLTSGSPELIKRYQDNSEARKRFLQQQLTERAARRR